MKCFLFYVIFHYYHYSGHIRLWGYYITVDLVIFACLNLREFLILKLFTKVRIREFSFLACLLILIEKGGLLQVKFGVVGVGVNIYLWAR